MDYMSSWSDNYGRDDSVLRHTLIINILQKIDDDFIIGMYHMLSYDAQIVKW